MRAAPLYALALLTLVPLGQAGTEANPEVNDRPDDAFYPPGGAKRDDLDLLRLWFQRSGNQLEISASLSAVTSLVPDSIYVTFFSTTSGRWWVSMAANETAEPAWAAGIWQGNVNSETCPEESDPYIMLRTSTEVQGEYEAGSPAYVTWSVRLKDVGLVTGDQVRDPFAIAYVSEGTCKQLADLTGKGKLWDVPKDPNFLERLVPGFELAFLVAAVASLAVVRRKK